MKITATPQVLHCLLKEAKINLYLSDVSKTSVQIAPPRHNLVQQTVCASYVALPCLLCGLCLARYLCCNSFSGTF